MDLGTDMTRFLTVFVTLAITVMPAASQAEDTCLPYMEADIAHEAAVEAADAVTDRNALAPRLVPAVKHATAVLASPEPFLMTLLHDLQPATNTVAYRDAKVAAYRAASSVYRFAFLDAGPSTERAMNAVDEALKAALNAAAAVYRDAGPTKREPLTVQDKMEGMASTNALMVYGGAIVPALNMAEDVFSEVGAARAGLLDAAAEVRDQAYQEAYQGPTHKIARVRQKLIEKDRERCWR